MANTKVDVFRFYAMDVPPDECWIWKGPVGGRTRALRPYFQYDGKRTMAYRVVYELVHNVQLTSDQLIKHSCDNGNMPIGCGNPKHLSLGTHSENMDDMKLRQRHGLPHHVVRRIRNLYADGRTQEVIADLYGLDQTTVSQIVRHATYTHVEEEEP